MPSTGRFSFPKSAALSWFVGGAEQLDESLQLKLLSGPFSSKPALIAAGLNTLLICSVALYLHPSPIFLLWLCADILIFSLRWLLLHRCESIKKPPLKYATDLSLILGLIWAAEIGFGTAICLMSGDAVLQVLACTSTVSMNGAIAMRNQGIPRYAFTQILLTDIPLKLSTLFQPEPMLMIFILQAPMYLIGLWVLLSHLNANLKNAYLSEAKSAHLANHDSLTGLLNRPGIFCTLNALLNPGRQHAQRIALLYLDLDGFKQVNDRCGHAVGDEALMYFSKILSENIRISDFASRIGGDEFVVVLQSASEECSSQIADRIITILKDSCMTNDLFTGLSVSVGIALADPNGCETSSSLLHRADIALYEAKSVGKGCYRFA